MTELERLLSQDDSCLISVASVKRALKQDSKKGNWIPVSERSPEESVPVLVQAEEIYYADSYTKGIIIGWRGKMGWYTITNKGREAIHYPIAWMPLPEPYKPESEIRK